MQAFVVVVPLFHNTSGSFDSVTLSLSLLVRVASRGELQAESAPVRGAIRLGISKSGETKTK
jgi:hypothetical protein